MRVGFVGLGKLGLPCALTLASCGLEVVGYDVSDNAKRVLAGSVPPPKEEGIEALLASTSLEVVGSVEDVVNSSAVVFVAVQTPHAASYGGEFPAPEDRRDFEYGFLVQAVRDIATSAMNIGRSVTVVIVSTVLPGTFNRHLRSLINPYVTLVYNPFFIAMGTTVFDLLNPEFVLCGADNEEHVAPLREVYKALHTKPLAVTSIESAELVKVSYNTFISMKIVFANMLMEIADKTGADCDQVVDVLSLATERVLSPSYLRGGMGDGGACHVRDLIAMSWLAQRLDLSADVLGYMVWAREAQTAWLADVVCKWESLLSLPVVLCGASYKPESNLVDGSPALLLRHILLERGVNTVLMDPVIEGSDSMSYSRRAVFVITTKHAFWAKWLFPSGSTVIDPFGYIPDIAGVTVVRIGRKS